MPVSWTPFLLMRHYRLVSIMEKLMELRRDITDDYENRRVLLKVKCIRKEGRRFYRNVRVRTFLSCYFFYKYFSSLFFLVCAKFVSG